MPYAVLAFTLSLCVAQEKPQEAIVGLLIQEFGSDNIEDREEATQRLKAMGKVVMPELEMAAKSTTLEVAFRASYIVKHLKATLHSIRPSDGPGSITETKNNGPPQVLIDIQFISTTNEDLLSFGMNYTFTASGFVIIDTDDDDDDDDE